MSRYSEYFLNSPATVALLELIEISHSAFSRVFRCVRNNVQGVTVTLETGDSAFFEYVPMTITGSGNSDDLDQEIKVQFGDTGEMLPTELDRVAAADAFSERPSVVYRAYRSDDLSTPLVGPLRLEIASLPFAREGVSFVAKAPSLNVSRTGEVYKLDRFPGLRGCL